MRCTPRNRPYTLLKIHYRSRKSGKLLIPEARTTVLYDRKEKTNRQQLCCVCLLGKPHEGKIAKRLRVVSGRHVLVGFTNESRDCSARARGREAVRTNTYFMFSIAHLKVNDHDTYSTRYHSKCHHLILVNYNTSTVVLLLYYSYQRSEFLYSCTTVLERCTRTANSPTKQTYSINTIWQLLGSQNNNRTQSNKITRAVADV